MLKHVNIKPSYIDAKRRTKQSLVDPIFGSAGTVTALEYDVHSVRFPHTAELHPDPVNRHIPNGIRPRL